MDAARWCFVLICHTLLTEREEDRVRARKERKKNKKEVFIDCKVSTLLPRTDFHCLNVALLVLHHLLSLCMCLSCLSGSDGAAIVALCQAGCVLAGTDTTPRRSPNLASIKVHLSGFYKNTIYCMFFLKGGP